MQLFESLLRYTVKMELNETTNRQDDRTNGLSLKVIQFLLNLLLQNLIFFRHVQSPRLHILFLSVGEVNCQYRYVPHEKKCPYKLSPNNIITSSPVSGDYTCIYEPGG